MGREIMPDSDNVKVCERVLDGEPNSRRGVTRTLVAEVMIREEEKKWRDT
jgi:hypothetical protein